MKKVLVIHYSQTGQLSGLLDSIVRPLEEAGIQVDRLALRPVTPYPFPWTRLTFFNAFPESVGRDPIPLQPFEIPPDGPYDLVILGYTIWFLNPSIPFNSFLKHPDAAAYIKDRPVLTVIGVRNMWVMAQEYTRRAVASLGGCMVGHITVVDRSNNLVSVITIIRWMFWGKRDPFFVFPAAGIRQEDVDASSRFGRTIAKHVETGTIDRVQPDLLRDGAIKIVPSLLMLEKRALFIFPKYRAYILGKVHEDPASRLRRVKVFSVVLTVGVFILGPLTNLTTALVSLVKRRELQEEVERLSKYG
ncbi:MAG: dialkylresorcinol condensing enzyme DarA [Flavobacteriales bacterium]|nr:dialkylresorcinol condensing enzyme DarA [Flavobacteriales bacterium]